MYAENITIVSDSEYGYHIYINYVDYKDKNKLGVLSVIDRWYEFNTMRDVLIQLERDLEEEDIK